MTPGEVAKSYDLLASYWNGTDFNRENGIKQHKRALQFVKHKKKAIDIGCGSSGRFIDLLLSEGFETSGLDASAEMIRLAKLRHSEQIFYHEDICQFDLKQKYDFISAWDSIWHVRLEEQANVLKKLCNGLTDQGVLIFTSGGLDKSHSVEDPCMGQPMYHATLGIPNTFNLLNQFGCVCRHFEYDQWPESHIYLVVQKVCHTTG